tara:strand:- start:707 stop:892 length:186 start_codon:yes stop_codon:yes gene_type:complete
MADRELAKSLPAPDTLKISVRKAYKRDGLVGDKMWGKILSGSQKSNKAVDEKVGVYKREKL